MDSVTMENPTEGIPLTESERRIWAEIAWAEQNAELLARYAGEWVALENRTVVAHGPDREEVLRAAAAATQRPEGEVAIWPILDVTALLSDSPSGAGEV
jgi:hypothetical protein